jgi:hypothetical protein
MSKLTLVVPGLLGPELPPGADEQALAALAAGLGAPALERLAGRADRLELGLPAGPACLEGLLFALCGVPAQPEADLPVAAVSLLGEGRDPGERGWLRLDPVHLRADLTDLVLVGPEALGLDAEQAARLVAALDEHLVEHGLRLEAVAPTRWYVALERLPALVTHPLEEAEGRPVSALLPRGADASWWRVRLNEAQMALHASPVNRERAARGLAPVNSVWPWGGGCLPARPARAQVDVLLGGGAFARGLANLAGARWEALPETLEAALDAALAGDGERRLVVVGDAGGPARATDVEGWRDALEAIDARWLAPSLDALRAGRIDMLALVVDRRRAWALDRRRARRFWRRPRRLAALLATARAGPHRGDHGGT